MSDISQLLERFRRGAEVVATATTGVAGSQLDFVPALGKWSIRQIVCHLADAELIGATRFRWVISEENPTLLAYNEKAWAANLNYASRRISQALEWCYSGRVFPAQEALAGRLVSKVVAPDDLLPTARALAKEFAAKTAPVSVPQDSVSEPAAAETWSVGPWTTAADMSSMKLSNCT